MALNTATNAFNITPNDSEDLIFQGIQTDAAAIEVGGAGDVRITTPKGEDITFFNRAAGSTLPYKARRVWATGTTATSLVAAVGDYLLLER